MMRTKHDSDTIKGTNATRIHLVHKKGTKPRQTNVLVFRNTSIQNHYRKILPSVRIRN